MATTATDICNLALAHLGEAPIANIQDDNSVARACAMHYEFCRDAVLRSHRWNFAQARVIVEADDTAPEFGWDHAFALPADCLRVLEVNDSELGDIATDEYIVEGGMILSNADTVNLVYLKKVNDENDFDPMFVKAFALKLAIELSETIRGTTGKTEQLVAMYERVTAPQARRVDANEGRRRKGTIAFSSSFVRARGAGA